MSVWENYDKSMSVWENYDKSMSVWEKFCTYSVKNAVILPRTTLATVIFFVNIKMSSLINMRPW